MVPRRTACLLVFTLTIATVAAETFIPHGVIMGTGHTVGYGTGKEEWRGEVIQISWKPRAFIIKGFLSEEECDHVINLAKPGMTKSQVVDNDTGESRDSDIRTSTGTFLSTAQDEVVARIEKRVAMITMVPEENQEGLQILRYVNGQKYEPHWDYFHDAVNSDPAHGGNRLVTMLMYLTTPLEGGETVFPNAEHKTTDPSFSECARQGLAVKPFRGDAIIFYSLNPDGTKDTTSLHGSCPTLKGEKWSATKWIHIGSQSGTADEQKAKWGDCIDANEQCREWAYMGECDKNPAYMRVSCRKACKVCIPKDKQAADEPKAPVKA